MDFSDYYSDYNVTIASFNGYILHSFCRNLLPEHACNSHKNTIASLHLNNSCFPIAPNSSEAF